MIVRKCSYALVFYLVPCNKTFEKQLYLIKLQTVLYALCLPKAIVKFEGNGKSEDF